MISPAALDSRTARSLPGRAQRRGFGPLSAYLAAPLWALQAAIWLAAPKVQEATAPFTITKPLLFALFWLSIAGAVAFSAACAAEAPRTIDVLSSRGSWWAKVLGMVALWLAGAATIAILAALVPALQGLALGFMTNLLNGALLVLALSLSVSAFISWRVARVPRSTSILVSAAAVATVAMITAILTSGSSSVLGLYAAVAVAALNAGVWLIWGRTFRGQR